MGKDFIGKRVRVQIGGDAPLPDDAVVGEDILVHVPAEDVGKYDSIIGDKVELTLSGDIDNAVCAIRDAINKSSDARRDQIVAVCEEILAEKDKEKKATKIVTLLSIGAKVAAISQFILQLKQALGG